MRLALAAAGAVLAFAGCLSSQVETASEGDLPEPNEEGVAAAPDPLAIEIQHAYWEVAATETFEIPAGVASATFQLLLQGASGDPTACPGADVEMVVTMPGAWMLVASASGGPSVNNVNAHAFCDGLDEVFTPPPAGEWTVEFRGNGAVVGVLRVSS